MHIIAAKAVCFKEALEPAFAAYQQQVVANAKALAAPIAAHGFRLVCGGTDNHLMLVDVFSKGITGKDAEAALGKAGHHREQEHDPLRPEPADQGQRHPHRHAGRDHARHGRGGDGPHRRVHRARAGRARRRRACTRWCAPKSKPCAGSSRCTRTQLSLDARVEARLRRRRPAGPGRCRTSSPGPGSARWPRPSPASSPTAASCSPKRAPAPARRSPTSCPRSSAASACWSPPAPRTCRSRSTSRTSRCCGDALGVPFTATYMKGRGNYLCLHRFAAMRDDIEAGSPADRVYLEMVDDWAASTDDRRPRGAGRSARDLPFWASIAATSENCLGSECPRVRRLLRHAHAPARGRLRRRHRQSPPALRRRRRAPGRVRRGDSRVRLRRHRRGAPARGRGHAVLRRSR